jgi:hypothetical protein
MWSTWQRLPLREWACCLAGMTRGKEVPLSYRDRVAPLRAALLANALFSTLTGAALIADVGHVAARLELGSSVSALVGGGLLLFGLMVALESRDPRSARVFAISAADLGWVLATGIVQLVSPREAAWVLGSSLVVAVLAAAQLVSLRRALEEQRPGLGAWRYAVVVDAHAPPAALWCVVRDVGGISRFMPELATSALRDGASPAVGAVRACSDHAGARWAEWITAFDESNRSFDVQFLDGEPGFPFPARPMFGGWRVTAFGAGSRVEVWWSLTPTVGYLPWLVVALMGSRVDRGISRAVARMDAAASGGEVTTPAELGSLPC